LPRRYDPAAYRSDDNSDGRGRSRRLKALYDRMTTPRVPAPVGCRPRWIVVAKAREFLILVVARTRAESHAPIRRRGCRLRHVGRKTRINITQPAENGDALSADFSRDHRFQSRRGTHRLRQRARHFHAPSAMGRKTIALNRVFGRTREKMRSARLSHDPSFGSAARGGLKHASAWWHARPYLAPTIIGSPDPAMRSSGLRSRISAQSTVEYSLSIRLVSAAPTPL